MKKIEFSTLVYIANDQLGSPNSKGNDKYSYIKQAFALNMSLIRLNFSPLTIFTNLPDEVKKELSIIGENNILVKNINITIDVPDGIRFYAAHFKLDMLKNIYNEIDNETISIVLDSDVIALKEIDDYIVDRISNAGIAVFDISDQVFPAYSYSVVVNDLEKITNCRLTNPRWYGGEFIAVTKIGLSKLLPLVDDCFTRYLNHIDDLHHLGDEMFISSAINLLTINHNEVIEVGAVQLITRHWSGNLYRDFIWFKEGNFIHCPGNKKLLTNLYKIKNFDSLYFLKKLSNQHRVKSSLKWVRRCIKGTK